MFILTEKDFKHFATRISAELRNHNISVKHRKSLDLLSYVLAERYWTALSPSLPIIIKCNDIGTVTRMVDWLSQHSKTISPASCEQLLDSIMYENAFFWTFRNDLDELEKKIAPIYHGTDNFGRVFSGQIRINPKLRAIDALSDHRDGDPDRIYGREIVINVPGEITGKLLTEVLTSNVFFSLLTTIDEEWYEEYDGHNQRGHIGDTTNLMIEDFYHEFEKKFIDSQVESKVGEAHDYLEPVCYYDEDGDDLDEEADDIARISFMDKYFVSADTDLEALARQIENEAADEGYDIRNVSEFINMYSELLDRSEKT